MLRIQSDHSQDEHSFEVFPRRVPQYNASEIQKEQVIFQQDEGLVKL